jgi:hypothetical protein
MEGYQVQVLDNNGEWKTKPFNRSDYESFDDMVFMAIGGDAWQSPQRIIDANGVVVAESIGIEWRYNTYVPNLLEVIRGDLGIEPDRFRQLCLEWLNKDKGQ